MQEIRRQVDQLVAQLELDQDPSQMSAIQELIGVSLTRGVTSQRQKGADTGTIPLQELLSQVTAIRDAATESEMVVRDITRDIQSLDLAKKNLVASMNALKRFQMLGTLANYQVFCSVLAL